MKKTAVLVYPDFSEYELTTALSILMQGGKPVSIISIDKAPVRGEAGLTIIADLTIEEVAEEQYDSLLLTGCMDILQIISTDTYIDFIKKVSNQKNFKIASISSSPTLLAKAGLLKNKKFTVGLTDEARQSLGVFEDAIYINEPVVQDGNIITARGSSFIEFGFLFGELLKLHFEKSWYQN